MASDTLSQNEIDSLLTTMTKGGEESEELKESLTEEESIQEYDFRRPVKFSRDQQRTLQLIHENFARELSTYLSGRCRTFVEVRYASIDQITFSEFQQSLSSPTYMAIFSTDVLNGSAIFQLGLDVGYVMIDKLLGGPGIGFEEIRSPTDIELNILRKESAILLKSLSKAWANITEFEVSLDKIETNPQFVQIAPPNDMTVLITLSITIREVQGFINLCFPASTLDSINDKLSMRMWTQSTKTKEKSREEIQNLLLLSNLNVSANLGSTNLNLGELLKMQIGDVLRLDTFHEDNIDINIQDEKVFKAKIGTNKGYYAAKVLEENDELIERILIEKAMEETYKKLNKEKNKDSNNKDDLNKVKEGEK